MPDLATAIRSAAKEMFPANPKSVLLAVSDWPGSSVAIELRERVADKMKETGIN